MNLSAFERGVRTRRCGFQSSKGKMILRTVAVHNRERVHCPVYWNLEHSIAGLGAVVVVVVVVADIGDYNDPADCEHIKVDRIHLLELAVGIGDFDAAVQRFVDGADPCSDGPSGLPMTCRTVRTRTSIDFKKYSIVLISTESASPSASR